MGGNSRWSRIFSCRRDNSRPLVNLLSRRRLPFQVNITFTSEADVQRDIQRELALRKVFRTHCPGLPRIDMYGWLAENVRYPALHNAGRQRDTGKVYDMRSLAEVCCTIL